MEAFDGPTLGRSTLQLSYLLLGVEIFTEVLHQGLRTGPPGLPVAIETEFGWVIAGKVDSSSTAPLTVVSNHATVTTDEILQQFWDVEKNLRDNANLSVEEKNGCSTLLQESLSH